MSDIDPPIIADPADVTPAWMTRVLRAAGHPVDVRELRREPVGTGQMAHNERFFLRYAGDVGDAPATLIGKFPSPSEQSRAAGASGGYRSEVRFYRELAGQLAIRVPACLYAEVSDDSTQFTLMLEDMAPAAQGDQLRGATTDELEAAIGNLTGLHGPRWGDPSLLDIGWMTMGLGEEAVGFVQIVAPIFLDRFGSRLSAEAIGVVKEFAAGVAHWLGSMPSPHTIVHGDYRLDNLLFATQAGGVPVTAVDWQTVSVSAGGRDVAYLLGTSSTAAARREHEPRLLERYRAGLAAHGVERSAAEVESDYRHGSFQGPFITLLGSMAVGRTERGDEMFIAMMERSAALIRDSEALDLLG